MKAREWRFKPRLHQSFGRGSAGVRVLDGNTENIQINSLGDSSNNNICRSYKVKF